MRPHGFLTALAILVALAGCAGLIKGVTNSNHYATLPSSASYTIEPVSGDPVMAPKYQRRPERAPGTPERRGANAGAGRTSLSRAWTRVRVGISGESGRAVLYLVHD